MYVNATVYQKRGTWNKTLKFMFLKHNLYNRFRHVSCNNKITIKYSALVATENKEDYIRRCYNDVFLYD